MYANLRVTTPAGKVMFAHLVEIERTGGTTKLRIHLDHNDGESNYAEPGGELVIYPTTKPIKIEADF